MVDARGGGREGARGGAGGLPLSGLVEVKTGVPAQVVSPGANRLKVTVPVGLKPPVTVAVSLMEPPTATPGDGAVVMTADDATPITTGSSAQAELTAALLASPL